MKRDARALEGRWIEFAADLGTIGKSMLGEKDFNIHLQSFFDISSSANKHKAAQSSTGLYNTTDVTERYLLMQRFIETHSTVHHASTKYQSANKYKAAQFYRVVQHHRCHREIPTNAEIHRDSKYWELGQLNYTEHTEHLYTLVHTCP